MTIIPFVILNFAFPTWCYVLNDRPIIGVLAQRLQDPIPGIVGSSYISASYVKYLEGAGARVVPIHINTTKEDLNRIFSYINGVLLPGGDADLLDSPVQRNAELLFDLAMQAYNKGDPFPMWGTCMGLQLLSVLTAKSGSVISRSFGTEDRTFSLNFTANYETSRMFSDSPPNVIKILQTQNVTYNAHYNCVSVDTFNENRKLNAFFRLLSTNIDARGKGFMSTMEGKSFRFCCFWFHLIFGA